MKGIPKGLCSFGGVTPHKMGRCREATEGLVQLAWGKAPQLQSAPQEVNSKTVQWTVFEEETPCK